MVAVARAPVAPLAPFIECLWSLADTPVHAQERVVPSGTFELVINLEENAFRIHDSRQGGRSATFSGAMVSGAYSRPFVIDTRAHASIVGVHFKPGGARPFLGLCATELADAHVDLDALWGAAARRLRERLCTATTVEQRFALIEEQLLTRLSQNQPARRAVRFAVEQLAEGTRTIAGLADEVGLSHRRFIELFSAEVGLTPQRFRRIGRFQRALSLAAKPCSRRWTEIALEAGYCDQAHLIREFVAFTGFTPSLRN